MAHLLSTDLQTGSDAALRAMFAARKSVFIDLLRWELPVLDGQFEIDVYDNENAHYLILVDRDGKHLASARLLPTLCPHILGDLFPHLSADPVPSGANVLEITRFCLDRSLRATDRRVVRNQLITGIVDYALAEGIERYTGVAEMGWLQQILSFGWDCRPLGMPLAEKGSMLGAIEIRITPDTPAKLFASGIWSPVLTLGQERRAVGANG
jgi:acyl-homoserine lactone synthase